MGPGKRDTIVWYWVTRHSQVFYGLTIGQWTLGFWDVTTGNSSLFSTFQSQSSPSTVSLANGSQSRVLGSGTIFPTPSIPVSYVLSLPNFSFNLVFVSKLTRSFKCCVSFFPDYCLF